MKTGYYTRANRPHYRSKVHIIENGQPLCGSFIHKDSLYQMCADFVYLPYVECQKCKDKWAKEQPEKMNHNPAALGQKGVSYGC